MKIERKEKQFEPIVITIETREELEHFVVAFAHLKPLQYTSVIPGAVYNDGIRHEIYEKLIELL